MKTFLGICFSFQVTVIAGALAADCLHQDWSDGVVAGQFAWCLLSACYLFYRLRIRNH